MNLEFRAGMIEATRLTRAGRLAEATALIQSLLQGAPARTGGTADAPDRGGPATLELTPESVELKERAARPTAEPDRHARPAPDASGAPPQQRGGVRERLRPTDRATRSDGLAAKRPAPAVVPDGARFITGSYSNEAGSRSYKLYVPSRYDGTPLPLVVMLHGCTQSPDDFAAGTQMNRLAEEKGCLVVYPEQAHSANSSKCWNWFNPGDQQHGKGEPSLIAGITRQVMHDYRVDEQRVFVAGLSAGGAAAAIMGSAYPDLYAAVGVHSGLACGCASDLPSAFAAMRRSASPKRRPSRQGRTVPTIVFHGDCDTTVNAGNGDAIIAQVAAGLGSSLQESVEFGQVPGGHAYSRTTYAEPGGPTLLEHWLIQSGGHAWSGGSPLGSYTDPKGPDATHEMLRFFLEHPRASAAKSG